mmetsp:Transcript_89636/g.141508  ORF Transcript_89636/g.141508 Transcript_89636/m.141508 type:complete len:764 (-) Transcript_89636:102-2393(-)
MLRPRRDVLNETSNRHKDSGALRGWESRSRSNSVDNARPPVQVRNNLSLKPRQKVILKRNSDLASRSVTPSSKSDEDDRPPGSLGASSSEERDDLQPLRRRCQNALDVSRSPRAEASDAEQEKPGLPSLARPADEEGKEGRRHRRKRRVKVPGEENTSREHKHRKRRRKELVQEQAEGPQSESKAAIANGIAEGKLAEAQIPGVSAKAKARRKHADREIGKGELAAKVDKESVASGKDAHIDAAPALSTEPAERNSPDAGDSQAEEGSNANEDEDEEVQEDEDGSRGNSSASEVDGAEKERASARASVSQARGDDYSYSREEAAERQPRPRRGDKDREERKRKKKEAREARASGRLDKKSLKKVKKRAELLIQNSMDKARTKKASEEKETEASQLRALIRGVYQRRNPTKLAEFETLMKKYAGTEAEVYAHVCQKYGETPMLPAPAKGSVPNGSELSKSKAKPGYAKKASAPAPPATLRVVPKVGPVLSPPRPIPSAAELFAAVEASKGSYDSSWPFVGEEDEPNSPSSSSASPARDVRAYYAPDMGNRAALAPHDQSRMPSGIWYRPNATAPAASHHLDSDLQSLLYPGAPSQPPSKPPSSRRRGEVDMYADLLSSGPQSRHAPPPPPLARPTTSDRSPPRQSRYDPPTPGAFRPTACGQSRGSSSTPIELQTFLGRWRDSMRHDVVVQWARNEGNRGGQLDVLLSKPNSGRDPIRLNIRQRQDGRFECGHYDLDLDQSHSNQIVWRDLRSQGKVSYWDRVR